MVVVCEEVWRQVSNYLDGEVAPELRSAIDEHVRGCSRCKAVLDGTRNVVEIYGDERMVEVPLGFSSRLHRKLEQNMPRQRGTAWGWMVAFAAAAMLLVAFEVGHSVASNRQTLRSEHADPGYRVPPDMMVVVATEGKTFHVAGCTFIHDKANLRTITAREAMQEGYAPCVRCMRKYLDTAQAEVLERIENDSELATTE